MKEGMTSEQLKKFKITCSDIQVLLKIYKYKYDKRDDMR